MDASALSLVLLYAALLAILVSVAVKRRAGFDTYWRMPLHLAGITGIAIALKYLLHPVFGVPFDGASLNRTGWWFAFIAPAVAFGWAFLRYGAGGRPAAAHKRGAVVTDGQAALAQTERLKERHGEQLLTLAGIWVAPADATKHFKLIGTTGAGKSTAIRELLHQALQRGDRAVIADPDGGYLASFYDRGRGDVILNPFDARSRKWSVFADIGSIQDADLMARSLIPDSGSTGSSGEREWSGYARTFVSAVLRRCMANGETDPAELWRLVGVVSGNGKNRTLRRRAGPCEETGDGGGVDVEQARCVGGGLLSDAHEVHDLLLLAGGELGAASADAAVVARGQQAVAGALAQHRALELGE